MLTESSRTKLLKIRGLAQKFDAELKSEFGPGKFSAGYCLLLGRYYAQSPYVYFSLNPGFPRSSPIIDPASPAGYNVPFRNPEALRKQYVYLHNCQRFFAAYPRLEQWMNNKVTSAFLVPWRTANTSDLRRLNQATEGRVFAYASRLIRQILHDHEAKLLIAAGRSALGLLTDLGIIERILEQSGPFGPGKSYQWSSYKLLIEGAAVHLLQIPHFSRANSPVKMRDFADWLTERLQPFSPGEEKSRILATDGEY